MSGTSQRERLLDLLADRALVGLDPDEDEELARLLVAFADSEAIARDIELAAAAVAVAAVSEQGIERMPPKLLARLDELAQDGMPTTVSHRLPDLMAGAAAAPRSGQAASGSDAPEPPKALKQTLQLPSRPAPPASVPARLTKTLPLPQSPQPGYAQPPGQIVPFRPAASPENAPGRGGRGFALAGWMAAAACLMLAVGAWYLRPRKEIVTVTVPAPASVAPRPSATPTPTPQEEREALIARAGTARLEWAKNAKDPASKEASGDVVWNAAEQRGYMRFRGLAKNDRRANVYQLWIFDKTRDDKYPVDGGVFDVDDETGDVIVPIKAKLPVGEVALFAVTVEKPGGVVVSKRERIVVTAKPAS